MKEPKRWKDFLLKQFEDCRNFPHWHNIWHLHDEDDREYWRSLEKIKEKLPLVVAYSDQKTEFKPEKIDADLCDHCKGVIYGPIDNEQRING